MEPKKGTLQPGETLLVDGPASVRILSGEGYVFGARVAEGERVVARDGKRIPINSASGRLEYEAKAAGGLAVVKGDAIPASWKSAAELIVGAEGRVVVLGGVDSGKTGFCTYLANRAVPILRKVGYVDGDVGQPEIGPPTAVTAAILDRQGYELPKLASCIRFVGSTSPSSCGERVVEAVGECSAVLESTGAKMVIVNTDGWVREGGLFHKAELVSRLKACKILSFLSQEEGEALRRRVGGTVEVVRLERPEHVRPRTQEERRRNREASYRTYFRQAGRKRIGLGGIELAEAKFSGPVAQDPGGFSLEKGLLVGL
ncbi:MAG: hypothetical protein JTT11_00320, partial [Candidatus Brockarchaeota archaeon]|nr:hypothetical protein [Candidatus Brockarchaeota archaeon]